MQHAIQYLLLGFIAGNALWQFYAAARWLTRRLFSAFNTNQPRRAG
jgi:hypothetical protein